MPPTTRLGCPPSYTVFLVFSTSLVLLILLNAHRPGQHLPTQSSSQGFPTHWSEGRAIRTHAVLSVDEYAHNFTADSYQVLITKREKVDFNAYVCKGARLLDLILHSQPLRHAWGPEDLENGWTMQPEVTPGVPEDLEPILRQLGIPLGPTNVHPVYMNQDRPFMDSSGYANT
ncbi:MAG: hypothetical protein Q9225_006899, partial [Loekoesia sp. 1 TL-2023]